LKVVVFIYSLLSKSISQYLWVLAVHFFLLKTVAKAVNEALNCSVRVYHWSCLSSCRGEKQGNKTLCNVSLIREFAQSSCFWQDDKTGTKLQNTVFVAFYITLGSQLCLPYKPTFW